MLAVTTKTRKSTKTVQIVARYFIKRNGHVVYAVRPSKGGNLYYTTIINGKATGCTCPATKPCYHMTQLEQIEAERNAKAISALCEWMSGFAATLQSKQDELDGYDVVGAALVVVNQAQADAKVADAFEQVAAMKQAPKSDEPESCIYCGKLSKHIMCARCAGC